MKNIKIYAVVLFVMGMIAVSCEGPEGPRGPAGAAGTNGTDGNANVSVYGFPSVTFTSALDYNNFDLPITGGMLDSSFLLSYYDNGFGWYEIGQLGPGGAYLTRYWLYDYTTYCSMGVRVHNADATIYSGADVTWDSVRIFVVPATQFYAAEPVVNFANYYEVENYFSQK